MSVTTLVKGCCLQQHTQQHEAHQVIAVVTCAVQKPLQHNKTLLAQCWMQRVQLVVM
jgi:hypothetical protein